MKQLNVYIIISLVFVLISFVACLNRYPRSSLIASSSSNDYTNYIQYSEISNRLSLFPSNALNGKKLNDFNEIAIDYENEFIYVGARNNLVKLSFKNDSLTLIDTQNDIINWEPSLDILNECKHSQTDTKNCQNYIRIILLNKSQLLTCGTNANKPLCTWRTLSNPSKIVDQFDATGKCPQSAETSLTYLKIDNDYYFATSIDYSSIGMRPDYLIERNIEGFNKKQIRTDQYNSNWMNEPEFVASIEIGNYVYFFFRETAIEYMNCGQKIYSRVARVCKYDEGTDNFNVWKTFEKARLNCSIPSSNYSNYYSNSHASNTYQHLNQHYSFSFDEIQSVFYDKKQELIYAIFSTPVNAIKGSAVCVYDLAALDKVFDGPFKHQKTKDSIWEPFFESSPNEKPKCEPNRSLTRDSHNKFQLKHLSVQPMYERPLLVVSNHRLTKLVADNVITKTQENIEILFIATEYNTILKYMLLNLDTASAHFPIVCLLEEIEIFESRKDFTMVNNLVLLTQNDYLSKSRSLLIATSLNLVKMPLARCESQTNYFSCLSLMDPYCIWDSKAQKCLLIFKTNETLHLSAASNSRLIAQNIRANTHLHQHAINSCPTTSQPVDGGFSEWSAWTSCMSKSGERCKCRMRLCNEPTPRNGGKNCDETKAIEILNCEVHGGWTEWSAWSACKGGQATNCEQIAASLTSKTHLEPAVRTRTRTCSNPEPKFNGRLCVGQDQEEEVCTLEMINPCSLVMNANLLLSSNNNLNLNAMSNGQWSSWGQWEECSKTCGEGFQMRRRTCNGKLCPGCNQEWRTCNSEPCKERVESIITEWDQIEASKESNQKLEKRFKFLCKYDPYLEANNLDGMELNSTTEYRICEDEKFCRSLKNLKELGIYSAWSEWSTCKSCTDVQHRTRKCSVVNTCFGHERETRDCDCTNLSKQDHGWSCWSEFGVCSSNCGKGVQRRTRKCLKPTFDCIGPKEEINTCFNANCSGIEKNFANEKLFASISSLSRNDKISITGILNHPTNGFLFTLTHLIITGVMSFLLGSLVVLLTIHIFFKSNSRKRKSVFCCCGQLSSSSDRYVKKSPACRDTQMSSSLDRNSDATDTAVSDLHNSECSKNQYCLAGSSDTTCSSANSNHSKEYFTVGNRFDSNGLSSLLNDIPDDDDDMLHTGLNVNYTPSSHSANNSGGTLGRSSNTTNNNKNLTKAINQTCLPNKSFNTYSTHKDLNNTIKNSKSNGLNSNQNIAITSSGNSNNNTTSLHSNSNNNNRLNTLTINTTSNKFSNFQPNGSIRSTSKQPRNSFAFNNLRTNLDQEL